VDRSTIRDVARHAGVSIATVSRVMRGSETVREHTRDRVVAAAEELQYVPSQLGRQLAERRYAANGIVFPDLSGPYYAEVVLGYESVAADLGRSVLILSTHGRAAAPAMVEGLAARSDGLVVLGRTVGDDVVRGLVRLPSEEETATAERVRAARAAATAGPARARRGRRSRSRTRRPRSPE